MNDNNELSELSKKTNRMIIQLGNEIYGLSNKNNNLSDEIMGFCRKRNFKIVKQNENSIILNDINTSSAMNTFMEWNTKKNINCTRLININPEDIKYYCEQILQIIPNLKNDSKKVGSIYFVSDFINSLNINEKQKVFNNGISYKDMNGESKDRFDKILLYTYFGSVYTECKSVLWLLSKNSELKVVKNKESIFLKYINKVKIMRKREIESGNSNFNLDYSFIDNSVIDAMKSIRNTSGKEVIYPADWKNKNIIIYNAKNKIDAIYAIARYLDCEVKVRDNNIVILRKKVIHTGDYINDIRNVTPFIVKEQLPYVSRNHVVKAILDKELKNSDNGFALSVLSSSLQCAVTNYISVNLFKYLTSLIINGMPESWGRRNDLIFKVDFNLGKSLPYVISIGEMTRLGYKRYLKASMRHL